MIEIASANPRFLRALARNLRPEDLKEIACFGVAPMRALWLSYKSSLYCQGASVDGQPAAVWGVSGDVISTVGSVWMLTGPAVERAKFTFLREARREVGKMLGFYPTLIGYVSRDYVQALRLVEALGFGIEQSEEQILQFQMRR